MYEMYPEIWSDKGSAAGRPSSIPETAADPPRRRARKEHQVSPRVLRVPSLT